MRSRPAVTCFGISLIVAIACLGSAVAVHPVLPAQASNRQADVYVTARDTSDRLTRHEPLKFDPLPQPEESNPTVILDASKTFQVVEGFGGALTDAASYGESSTPGKRRTFSASRAKSRRMFPANCN